MRITLNGEKREVAGGTTVQTLLDSLGFTAEATVVERNMDILDRSVYATTFVADADTIELVRFVGGG